ncbi:MAG TPA: hypothetical protein VMT03_14815 [Polyangia bacterium]|nr:hypothetical protein [Polyangia bacterium]
MRRKPRGQWAGRLNEPDPDDDQRGEPVKRRELVREYAIDLLVTLVMEERTEEARSGPNDLDAG